MFLIAGMMGFFAAGMAFDLQDLISDQTDEQDSGDESSLEADTPLTHEAAIAQQGDLLDLLSSVVDAKDLPVEDLAMLQDVDEAPVSDDAPAEIPASDAVPADTDGEAAAAPSEPTPAEAETSQNNDKPAESPEGPEQVTLQGSAEAEDLIGGAAHDVIAGGAGIDRIEGGDGNDVLHGDDDTVGDWLDGGNGDDQLHLSGGDWAIGGLGADEFVLYSSSEEPATITDFAAGTDHVTIRVDDPETAHVTVEHDLDGSAIVFVDGDPLAFVTDGQGLEADQITVRPA